MIAIIALIVAFCAIVLIGLLRLIRELLEDFFHPPGLPGEGSSESNETGAVVPPPSVGSAQRSGGSIP